MPKTVQKRQSTAVRREQIVDAARVLIIKYGSEHITVRRIAKEIGVSEGAIYRHFKSKRDILFFLIDHIKDDLVGDIENSKTPGCTPLQILDSALRNHISAVQQRRGISFQVIAEIISLGDKRLNKKASQVLDKYTASIRDILSEGVKTGEIAAHIDLDAAATLFSAMIQGLVNTWTLSDHSFNLEQKYLSLWSILRDAIIRK